MSEGHASSVRSRPEEEKENLPLAKRRATEANKAVDGAEGSGVQTTDEQKSPSGGSAAFGGFGGIGGLGGFSFGGFTAPKFSGSFTIAPSQSPFQFSGFSPLPSPSTPVSDSEEVDEGGEGVSGCSGPKIEGPAKLAPVETKTGEEDEETELQSPARLFRLTITEQNEATSSNSEEAPQGETSTTNEQSDATKPATPRAQWRECGSGTIKINCEKATNVRRIIFRNAQVGSVGLNVGVGPGLSLLPFASESSGVRITTWGDRGAVSYCIKTSKPLDDSTHVTNEILHSKLTQALAVSSISRGEEAASR